MAKALIDLTSTAFAEDLPKLVERSEGAWNIAVEGIVYPLFWHGGMTYSPDRFFESERSRPGMELIDVVRFCKDMGLTFWLSIELALPPVRAATLHVQDYYGTSARHACINSPATRTVLHEVLQPLEELGLMEDVAGFSLSMQDLWPMSSTKGVVRPTCFCNFCRKVLQSWVADMWERADRIPDPFAVGLRDSASGIDSVTQITWDTSPEVLLTQAAGGGFIETGADPSGQDVFAAEWAIDYTHARHESTVAAIRDCVAVLKDFADVPVSGTTSDISYDWTSGIFFQHLLSGCPVDEIWVDPSPDGWNLTANHRYYLLDRANYYLHGFAESYERAVLAEHSSDGISSSGARSVHLRAAGFKSRFPSRALALVMLPPANDQFSGVVIPPFTGPADVDKYSSHFPYNSEESPLNLLQQFLLKTGSDVPDFQGADDDDDDA